MPYPLPRKPRFPLRPLWLTATFLLACQPDARAWSNHTLCTWQAVGPLPEVEGHSVPAESLGDFLSHESAALPAALETEERWARTHLSYYAPRPDALAFQPTTADAGTLKRTFLRAIRVNETVPMELYVQHPPGATVPPERTMTWPSLTVLKSLGDTDIHSLERVDEGTALAVADVIATASNEPDFGMDIGLWLDNDTGPMVEGPQTAGQAGARRTAPGKMGAVYGYGPQPFGNPRLDYGSQAPFHMGFYHESGLITRAAPYLLHSYPEARIHLFMTLSRFAFAHGHPYWGWRFAGWAVHYVQDLAQPYHARALPGVGPLRMIGTSLLDMAGFHGPRTDAINLVTNRHTVLENYQYRRMAAAYEQGDMNDPLLAALRDTSDDATLPRLLPASPRDIVSAQSADAADALDAQLEKTFPAHYVSDPATVLDTVGDLDLYSVSRQSPAEEQARLTDLVAARMRQAGRDTRAVIRAVTRDDNGGPLP